MFTVTTSSQTTFDDLPQARAAAQALEAFLGAGTVHITEVLPPSYRQDNPQYTGPLRRSVSVHAPTTKGRTWQGGQEAEVHMNSLAKSILAHLTKSGFVAPDPEVFSAVITSARMTGEIDYPAVFLLVKEATNGAVEAAKHVIFEAEKDFAVNQLSRSLSKFK